MAAADTYLQRSQIFKPLLLCLEAFKFYNQLLGSHPIITKAITSGIISGAGATVASLLNKPPPKPFGEDDEEKSNKCQINKRSVFAFSVFGLVVTGPLAHFFYTNIDVLAGATSQNRSSIAITIKKILIERFIWAPSFLLVTLYLLDILQGRSFSQAADTVSNRYFPSLIANWKIWTIPQILNLSLVPVQFRVLIANMVAFVWAIYLSKKSQKKVEKQE